MVPFILAWVAMYIPNRNITYMDANIAEICPEDCGGWWLSGCCGSDSTYWVAAVSEAFSTICAGLWGLVVVWLSWFSRHILSGCRVCDWGIQYHLCSTYRGLWGLVVVWLVWLSGRALAAQARGVLGSTPRDCWPFTFLYFRLVTSKFLYIHAILLFNLL